MEYIFNGVVDRIIDGDTVDVTVDLGFNIFSKHRLRLNGIDTSELSSKDVDVREKALEAKNYLTEQVLGRKIEIITYKADKYGRYLADLVIDGKILNEELVQKGLAVYYDGGKR